MKLQVGDRVPVFQDPITEEKLEGMAVLRRKLGHDVGVFERWEVEFDADPGVTYERSVRPRP